MPTDLFFRLALVILLVAFVAHRGYYTRKFGQPEATTLKARPKDNWQTLANLLSLSRSKLHGRGAAGAVISWTQP